MSFISFMLFMSFILLSGLRLELVAIAATEDLSRTTLRRSSKLLPGTPHKLRLFPPQTPRNSPELTGV